MENGFYITPKGERVEVLSFDPINKMVYTPLPNGNFMWVHDTEYSKWVKEGEEKLPEEVIEEQVNETPKKRTYKKKEK